MSRNNYAFTVLQAIAATASLAIIMWSLGLPVLQFAEAANVTSFSATMSETAPSAASDYTIEFTTPTGVAAGETIVLTFDAAFSGVENILFSDLDLNVNAVEQTLAGTASGATWGATTTATTITLTSGTGVVGAGETVIIQVGANADSGVNQITNPAKVAAAGVGDSYELQVAAGSADSGETRVVIIDAVTVTAAVDTIMEFQVNAVNAGIAVGDDTTAATTTATTIPFGELSADTEVAAAQALEVSTNAANGFVVTVAADQQLLSANGADIDGYIDGAFTNAPTAWTQPGATPGAENEYGHWGLTSTDTTLTGGGTNFFDDGGQRGFVSASTTPVEVFRETGPSDSATESVVYKVEVTSLQEAATDYTATLTYVATPVF